MPVVINGSIGISGTDGSASTPAVQGTDTNTGLFFPAADTIAFAEGGTEVMRIDASGNVGIGTPSPGARLAIQTAAGTAARQTIYTASNAAAATLSFGQVGAVQWDTGCTAAVGDYRIAIEGGGTAYDISRIGTAVNYHAFSAGGGERMRIDSAGNVGIGTTTPTQRLSVDGNATFTGTAVMASSFLRNRLINGGFDVWQRGTSTSTSGAYLADRWIIAAGTSITATQSSDVPSGFRFSLSLAGTAFPQTIQRIESINCFDLVGQSVTVSFWAKQTVGAGSNSLAVQLYSANAVDNFGATTVIGTQLLNGSTSWTRYTATFSSLPAAAANGLQVLIYANTAGSATFLVTGVQLEVGSVATPFERRQFGQELALCQRYFVSFGGQNLYEPFGAGVVITSTIASIQLSLPVSLRTTLQTFVAVAPTSFLVNDGVGSPLTTSITYDTGGLNLIMFNAITGGGLTAGRGARLFSNLSTATRLQIGAEL